MRARDVAFGTFCVACLAAMTWPGYAWFAASARPSWFGLPFSLVWVVGWVFASFVALNLYHASGRHGS